MLFVSLATLLRSLQHLSRCVPPCPPIFPILSAMQAPSRSTPLFIQLPGVEKPQFLLAEGGQYVGQVTKAIVTEFNQLRDVKVDQVQLFKLDGSSSSRTLLYPTQTLGDAGILAGTRLAVELTAAASISGSSTRNRAGKPSKAQPRLIRMVRCVGTQFMVETA